jgi:uncharacterized protein with ParB-like and HNH nuclease domain
MVTAERRYCMSRIQAHSRSIRDLLKDKKYYIDFYQREYRWQREHVSELLEDLEAKFMDSFSAEHSRKKVLDYEHYFLGSVIISEKDGIRYIIDGQQRLTSLTLLLIYLHHLQNGRPEDEFVNIQDLIYSTEYGEKTFNLNVDDRIACMDGLFKKQQYDATGQPESIRNIVSRYHDIETIFPETLKAKALPYFIDWLIGNVDLVEITAYTDDDAYMIFETMNDRGLSLTPTEMLKSYLLANIEGEDKRVVANNIWKKQIESLLVIGKEEDAHFIKAWLRAKYAETIRERKKAASNADYEDIGTSFHKWVGENRRHLGIGTDTDFSRFVQDLFVRYSEHYIRIRRAARLLTPSLEYVYYNAYNDFTLQYPLLLAPIRDDDDIETADEKIRLTASYLDILIARRMWNYRTLSTSALSYTMFLLMKEIREKNVRELAAILQEKVAAMEDTFSPHVQLSLHMMNRPRIRYLLARMTTHVEQECGMHSSFVDYVKRDVSKPYEIEHIWSDNYEEHADEFSSKYDFAEYRNRIGDLVLLPRGFNQSLGAAPFEKKVGHYYAQNLLARSLSEQCYQNNPSFLSYVSRSGLPFRPYKSFKKADLDERQELYRLICEQIWSPSRLAVAEYV